MPLTSPQLDDLDYATIQAMLVDRIPTVAPEWTDYNDSDPGIALIQLFAYLGEQVGYRLNRVPEKAYVEFLKLVGVELAPAVAASTTMSFILAKPERATGLFLPPGTRIASSAGSPPPTFETDVGLDMVPAQIAALITTRGDLTDINAPGETGPTAAGADPKTYVAERYSLAWDGKSPKLKDMPTQPVPLFYKPSEATQRNLYIALAFNQSAGAGFKGQRVSLAIQIDQDEFPEEDTSVECGGPQLSVVNAFGDDIALVSYAWYRPPDLGVATGSWESLPVIADTTDGWTRSGTIRFDVPMKLGPIPSGSWTDVEPGLPHPLPGALKTPVDDTPADVPVSGWLRVTFAQPVQNAYRAITFNSVGASNLSTVNGERLGSGNGMPGQLFTFANANLSADTVEIVTRDDSRVPAIVGWTQAEDFDTAGPSDTVYVLDPEAGALVFGDGTHGRPPSARESVIANFYRYGGGLSGDVATGTVTQPVGLPAAVSDAVNVTPAEGGRDAETLDDAKIRAPHAFRARGRAVTNADFVDAAIAAPGVQIARASVVPLHRPYPQGNQVGGLNAPGVNFDQSVAGALTVIAVPQQDGLYPMPTTSQLTAVATALDAVRLITTEVYVTTPQYVRLYDLQIGLRAAPGYSLAQLREAVSDALTSQFHALTGGSDGTGFPFGGLLHHADLVAATLRVRGVQRVEALSCMFDGKTPDNADRPLQWRVERQTPMRLTNCPGAGVATDTDHIELKADELPFIDTNSLSIVVTGAS